MQRFLIFISNTTSAQWGFVEPPEPYFSSYFITSVNGALYHAGGKDIFKSNDDGNSWENITNGFITDLGNQNNNIQIVEDNIFIGSTIMGVYMSPDNGVSWQLDTAGLDPDYYTQVDLLY